MEVVDINMKEHSQKIKDIVLASSNVLMHLHPGPDADSYGSTVTLANVIQGWGKKVTVITGDSPLPESLACLPLSNTLTHSKLSDINLSEYDCYISLDSSNPQMISRVFDGKFPQEMNVIVIDHHASNVGYGTYNWVDSTYPACAHMVFDLIQGWKEHLTVERSTLLFLGMYTDTGGFKYASCTGATLRAAAFCRDSAPNIHNVINGFESQLTLHDITFQSIALASTTSFAGGKVMAGWVSHDDLKKHDIPDDKTSASYISAVLRLVQGAHVSVGLVAEGHTKVKVSMRSSDGIKYDVSKIAQELGGGGHKQAAGCFLECSMGEAREKVIPLLVKLVENQ